MTADYKKYAPIHSSLSAKLNDEQAEIDEQHEEAFDEEKLLPPSYLEDNPLTKSEFDRWDAYISSKRNWTQAELILLHRYVRIETKIEIMTDELIGEEATVQLGAGLRANPVFTAYTQMQKLGLVMLKQIGLNDVSPATGRKEIKKKDSRKKGKTAGSNGKVKEVVAENLIRMPRALN